MAARRGAPLRRALALLAAALCVAGPSRAAPAPPPAPDNSGCGRAYHANATHMLQLAPKQGFGVIFVAHHGDAAKKQSFVEHAIESANSYRRASMQLPRALITSEGGPPLPDGHPFDQVVIIPPCLLLPEVTRPQKLTRTLAYHLTPFELTLAVDLDTFNCVDIYPVMKNIYATERRKWVQAANGHETHIWHPDHGVKLFWFNDDMRRLLWLWEAAQVEKGVESSDQIALMHALRTHPEEAQQLQLARLPQSMSCRIRPGVGESFAMAWDDRHYSLSLPIYGPLYIIHMDGIQHVYREICAMANEGDLAASGRSIMFSHPRYFPDTPETARAAFSVARSQAECEAVMKEHCFPNMRFTPPEPFAIKPMPLSEYEY